MGLNLNANRPISETIEVRRIRDLPRRTWTETSMAQLARELTEVLKTPHGKMALRPVQALALHDIGTVGGLFGPIRVGGGKTLLSLLAPYVLGSTRPLLLLPAALVEKTERERREKYAEHWLIPRNMRIMSYEMLGRVQAAETLEYWRPDLIVCDESHRLKNKRAACTRRVSRYMKGHPDTKFVAISGTVMTKSLKDFGHILRWALKDGAPVPAHDGELEEWADALDERVNPFRRPLPGALLTLSPRTKDADNALQGARHAFQERLLSTPGVVATTGEQVACSLYISAKTYDVAPVTETHFKRLRDEMETPDGWAFAEAVEGWRHARELALGLHYRWDPFPPDEWLAARKVWAQFVRRTLSASRTLDTELQVRLACKKGALDATALDDWARLEPTFTPRSKAVWHDDAALQLCQAWMREPGIVWCEHTFFAEELSTRTGADYYGSQGLNARGQPIEKASIKKAIIASVAANSTGRNLQAWSRNLITACPTGAAAWEQLLGRTHRDGQEADEVTADVLLGCTEHFDSWTKALAGARAATDTLGDSQKLLIADISFPEPADLSPRFRRAARG